MNGTATDGNSTEPPRSQHPRYNFFTRLCPDVTIFLEFAMPPSCWRQPWGMGGAFSRAREGAGGSMGVGMDENEIRRAGSSRWVADVPTVATEISSLVRIAQW
jgi:hypothetical protein